jgi:hypothetical protein
MVFNYVKGQIFIFAFHCYSRPIIEVTSVVRMMVTISIPKELLIISAKFSQPLQAICQDNRSLPDPSCIAVSYLKCPGAEIAARRQTNLTEFHLGFPHYLKKIHDSNLN